ncbi:MAG: hypothetical protein JXR95_09595 [Deltaproteobacteria bacterium]|nr:hypothetical protein [Deltaproteobacteria bacterium]
MKNTITGFIFFLIGVGLTTLGLYKLKDTEPSESKKIFQAKEVKCPEISCPVCPAKKLAVDKDVKTPDMKPVDNPNDDSRPLPMKDDGSLDADSMNPAKNLDTMVAPMGDKSENTEEKDYSSKENIKKQLLIYFPKKKKIPASKYITDIKKLAGELYKHKYEIGVRCGDAGDLESNRHLARMRVKELKKILVESKIPENRISYRIFPGNPKPDEKKKFSERYWRRARIKALPWREK